MKNFTLRLSAAFCLALCCLSLSFAQTPLAANGKLQVVNRQLTNEAGTPIQLRGISSHGLHWFPQCFTQSSVEALANDWGADVFRAAMYVDEGGYLNDKVGLRNKVNQIVDWSEQAGMYCIIDWHILNPGDPNIHTADAIEFFKIMAQRNAGKKNVIYEICNEPNNVSWASIKSYAEQVIPVIRQYAPDAIILVGTPNYSGTPGDVRGNMLSGANAHNVMYSFHFYAGSHNSQPYIDDVIKTVPLFISEWGTSNFTGNGGNDYNNAQNWVNLMAGNNTSNIKLSWVNWNFADKNESSSALNPGACNAAAWNNTSTSGTWVKDHLLNPADNFGSAPPPPPTNQLPMVSLTAPTNNAAFTAPASVAVAASAADSDGSVAKVEFYDGSTKLGEDATAPYTFSWSNVAAGTYTLTAKAFDNQNATTTSAAVTVYVNNPGNPSADLLGPNCVLANETKSYELNSINLPNATSFSWWCTGSTQSITQVSGQPSKVNINFGPSFTGGEVCVGVNYSAAPWYKQYCKSVTVCTGTPPPPPPPPANIPPTVSLTAPANNATFTAPASITISANATDSDGSVAKVEFYNGSAKLGEKTTAPYNFSWSNVAAGTHNLTAKATDNMGATATSATFTVTVNASPPPPSPTADIVGPDCATPNQTKVFELNATKLANATNFSWWFTGSSQSITPVAGQPHKVSIAVGPWFNGGQVCVGVNYAAAPWYQQYCKSVAVCGNGARLGALERETSETAGVVYPNPSSVDFTFIADKDISQMKVNDMIGYDHLQFGALRRGEQIRFGESLATGVYLLKVEYSDQTTKSFKVLKVSK